MNVNWKGYKSYWQLGKTSQSANKYMFENQLYTDVEFEINGGDQPIMKLSAHKYILVSKSPVFEAMFGIDMVENSNKDGKACITISDIDADAFKETLKFMYCDKADISFQNVSSVLYASKKYFLDELTKLCKTFLEKNLEIDNICAIIDHSIVYHEMELTKKCLNFISTNVKAFFSHETFLNLSQAALQHIVNYDYLYIESESWLYKECLRWAKHKRKVTAADVTKDDETSEDLELRNILGDVIYKIRFMNMTGIEFAKEVGKGQILSDEEKSLIYYHILTNEELPVGSLFNQNDRVFKCSRYGCVGTAKQWWSCNGPTEAIDFSTDLDIYLIAIGLYGGKCNSQHEVKVEICLLSDETNGFSKLNSVEEVIYSDGSHNLCPVYFEYPVLIEAHKVYMLLVSIKGTLTHYGINGRETLESAGVTFKFTSSSQSINGTNVKSGQIPEIIFSKTNILKKEES